MRFSILGGVAVLMLLALALAGCGGGNSAGPTVTLQIFSDRDRTRLPAVSWVAFQDGDGPWRHLAPTTTGIYTETVTDPAGRYSFALAQALRAKRPSVYLYHGTIAELSEIRESTDNIILRSPAIPPTPAMLTGTTSGYPADPNVLGDLSTGTGAGASVSPSSPDYTISLPAGRYDLIAALRPSFDPSYMSIPAAEQIGIVRNLRLKEGNSRTINVDFATLPATLPATVSVANGSAERGLMSLITDDGGGCPLALTDSVTAFTSYTYRYPDPSQLVASDRFYAYAISDTTMRYVRQSFTSPGDQTLTLPEPLGAITSGLNTVNAVLVPTVSWQPYAGAAYWRIALRGVVTYSAFVTAGWLNGATTYTAPDLSGVEGWDPTNTLTEEYPVSAIIDVFTSNLPVGQALRFPSIPLPVNGFVTDSRADDFGDPAAAQRDWKALPQWYPGRL